MPTTLFQRYAGNANPPHTTRIGEEFAALEKLGLAPKVLQNFKGSAEPFFNRLFTIGNVLQNLPAEPHILIRDFQNDPGEPPIKHCMENASESSPTVVLGEENTSLVNLRPTKMKRSIKIDKHGYKKGAKKEGRKAYPLWSKNGFIMPQGPRPTKWGDGLSRACRTSLQESQSSRFAHVSVEGSLQS